MLNLKSDIELWNASLEGDQEAFGLLFRRHYPLLFQYGIKISSDPQTIQDAIQELFIDLWQKKTGQPIQSLKAYLLQALKFKLYKSFRQNKDQPTIEVNENEAF